MTDKGTITQQLTPPRDNNFSLEEIVQKHNFLGDQPIAISFTLKICLHLKNGELFLVHLPNRKPEKFLVVPEEVIEERDQRFGSSENIEILSDIESAFRFTRLTVLFSDANYDLPLERVKVVHSAAILEALNKFIDSYRFTTGRHTIQNIYNLNDLRELSVRRGSIFETSINFGGAGAVLTPFKNLRDDAEHEKIKTLAAKDEPFPLEQLFLMDAMRYAAIGHELQALINGVIALEIILNKERIEPSLWDRMLRYSRLDRILSSIWVGRPTRMRVGRALRLRKIPERLVTDVIFSIKERNRVIHGGRRRLKKRISEHLAVITEVITLVQAFTLSPPDAIPPNPAGFA